MALPVQRGGYCKGASKLVSSPFAPGRYDNEAIPWARPVFLNSRPARCHRGFRIRSAVPLRFLRQGGGVDPLEIVTHDRSDQAADAELLGEWPLQGTSYPATAKLLRVPGGYEYWTSDAGLFLVDYEHQRIGIPANGDELLREQRLYGMPLILSFASRGDASADGQGSSSLGWQVNVCCDR